MSKERLEEIIKLLEDRAVIDRSDYEWLVEQAEQKQSLETAVDFYQSALRDADRRVQELENVNRVLKKSNVGSERAKERLRNWIDELEIENERYREALEFYANKINYLTFINNGKSNIEHDQGGKARKALEGGE